MHLSVKHSQAIEDADTPVNPSQTPADILYLSFTDSDLACMAVAAGDIENLRLSKLALLKHPLSVDLYIEQVAQHAKVILVRLLGGYDWWKYGAEEFAKLARRKNIKLLMVSGNGHDPRLAELATIPKNELDNIENLLAQGGVENAKAVLEYLQLFTSPSPPVGEGILWQWQQSYSTALII